MEDETIVKLIEKMLVIIILTGCIIIILTGCNGGLC